jgi:hypothetical protein
MFYLIQRDEILDKCHVHHCHVDIFFRILYVILFVYLLMLSYLMRLTDYQFILRCGLCYVKFL